MRYPSKSIIALFILLIIGIGCEKDVEKKNPNEDYVEYNKGEGDLGKAGGIITFTDPESDINGTKIEIPEGAMEDISELSISETEIPNTFYNNGNTVGIQLLPEGQTFTKPVKVTLPYNKILHSDSIQVWYYNENDSLMVQHEILEIDQDKNFVTIETNHFSDFYTTKENVNFKLDFYKWNNEIAVKINLINPLSTVPTYFPYQWPYNIQDLVDEQEILRTVFSVDLKEKNTLSGYTDKIVSENNKMYFFLNGPLAGSATLYKYAEIHNDDKTLIQRPIYQKDAREFLSGELAYIVLKDIQDFNPNTKYYVTFTWYIENGRKSKWTQHYVLIGRKGARTLANLPVASDDRNNNQVVDYWEDVEPKFHAFPESGEAPLNVEFTNRTQGNVESWLWDFGDGTISKNENPIKIYSNAGTYTVSLTATNSYDSYTTTIEDYIVVDEGGIKPAADFLASLSTAYPGDLIEFYDASTLNVDNWYWDFGDGVTSTLQDPIHSYANPGKYTVSLTVTNDYGSDTETKSECITINPFGDLPVVVTLEATDITETSAILGCNVVSDGGISLTGRGICLSTHETPTLSDLTFQIGEGTGSATTVVEDLIPNTVYYVRAFAKNAIGITYGSQFSFRTEDNSSGGEAPITDFSASKYYINEGESVQFNDETKNNPTSWAWEFGDGGTSDIQNPVHKFQEAGKYDIKLTTHNAFGGMGLTKADYITVYDVGNAPEADFSASKTTVYVGEAVDFSDLSTNEPTSWNWTFGDEYTSNSQNPSHEYSNAGTYTVSLTATNSYGSDMETKNSYIEVITELSWPTVTTAYITSITTTAASGGGDVTNDGGSEVLEKGVCWSQNPDPTINDAYINSGSGSGSYTSPLTGLWPDAVYYVRAYARNSIGVGYGQQITFRTLSESSLEVGSLVDYRDSHVYNTVKIGNQWWMAENLAYLSDMSPPTLESATAKHNYVYDYNGSSVANAKSTYNYDTYGVLYNWLSAQDVCPSGWHLPSESEFQELEATLGMSQSTINLDEWRGDNEGGMLKTTGTSHWINPNSGATNETGFSALPAGLFVHGSFSTITEFTGFWSSTSYTSTAAYYRALQYDKTNIRRANYKVKNAGYSVRCVKDNEY